MSTTAEGHEPVPPIAADIFGDRLERAEDFVRVLSDEGVLRGLIGPSEPARLWSRHILNSAVLGEAIPPGLRVVDIGSGAGFPGVPLAIARPDLDVVLVDPLLRRTTFLEEVAERLKLDNVTVVRGRAEEAPVIAEFGGADVVTSRAVAPLDRLARWSAPLIRIDGELLALKGRTAQQEIEDHAPAAARVGLANLSVVQVGVGLVDPPTTVIRGVRVETDADRRASRRADRRRKRRG